MPPRDRYPVSASGWRRLPQANGMSGSAQDDEHSAANRHREKRMRGQRPTDQGHCGECGDDPESRVTHDPAAPTETECFRAEVSPWLVVRVFPHGPRLQARRGLREGESALDMRTSVSSIEYSWLHTRGMPHRPETSGFPLPQNRPPAAAQLPGDPTIRQPAGVPVPKILVVLSRPDFPLHPRLLSAMLV